jgi:hypothetical protein
VENYFSAQLDALGDATRRAILERLLERPQAVVIDHAAGTRRVYRLNPAGVERLRAYFDQFASAAHGAAARA